LAGKVTAGLAECNGSLPPDGWLKVTCGLTACTHRSGPAGANTQKRVWENFTFTLLLPESELSAESFR